MIWDRSVLPEWKETGVRSFNLPAELMRTVAQRSRGRKIAVAKYAGALIESAMREDGVGVYFPVLPHNATVSLRRDCERVAPTRIKLSEAAAAEIEARKALGFSAAYTVSALLKHGMELEDLGLGDQPLTEEGILLAKIFGDTEPDDTGLGPVEQQPEE